MKTRFLISKLHGHYNTVRIRVWSETNIDARRTPEDEWKFLLPSRVLKHELERFIHYLPKRIHTELQPGFEADMEVREVAPLKRDYHFKLVHPGINPMPFLYQG